MSNSRICLEKLKNDKCEDVLLIANKIGPSVDLPHKKNEVKKIKIVVIIYDMKNLISILLSLYTKKGIINNGYIFIMVARDKIHPDNWLWNLSFFDIEKYKANKIKPETIVSFKPYNTLNDIENGEKQKIEKRAILQLWLNSFLKFKASVEVKYKGIANIKKKISLGKELLILINGANILWTGKYALLVPIQGSNPELIVFHCFK